MSSMWLAAKRSNWGLSRQASFVPRRYPRATMADHDEGWAKLARNLKPEIDSELIEKYRGKVSLPFEPGPHKRIAVKIIDDRGIESVKVVGVK
jgi:adenine-specific DNA-methyltransferase